MFGRKSVYIKCFESLENELKINLENNYKDLAWDAVKNLRSYVDSLQKFEVSGGKSISPWITGGVKRPPIHGEIEKLTKTVEAYEKQMEGYHH